MKTLIEHVESLSRYSDERPDEILWSILHNKRIVDEDSLLVYRVESYYGGNELNIMWGDGDGKKMEKWANKIAKENNCVKMYIITKRWKPFIKKYKGRPVAVILEREVE